MRITLTATFVCDERTTAERLKRQIESLITEHGDTWVPEVDFEVDAEGTYE